MVDKIPTAVIDLTSDNGTDKTIQLYEAQNLLQSTLAYEQKDPEFRRRVFDMFNIPYSTTDPTTTIRLAGFRLPLYLY
jgi:hypothetical protein